MGLLAARLRIIPAQLRSPSVADDDDDDNESVNGTPPRDVNYKRLNFGQRIVIMKEKKKKKKIIKNEKERERQRKCQAQSSSADAKNFIIRAYFIRAG